MDSASISNFAKKVGVTPQAIRKAIKEGRLRADKYENPFWLIHPNEVKDWNRKRIEK